MGKEEQIEEREVLESIYPDEITSVSETEFRISISLDLPPDDSGADPPDAVPPTMQLSVRYPEAYPDEGPGLDILPGADSGTATYQAAAYFSVAADRDALLAGLAATVEENVGMAMVFTLVTAVKEAAEELVASRRAAAAAGREERARAAERVENAKFHGTPVNPATFAAWRDGFVREMEERRAREDEERAAELKKARVKDPAKLTGRQLWERGLAGKVEEGEDDEDEPVQGVEGLKIEG